MVFLLKDVTFYKKIICDYSNMQFNVQFKTPSSPKAREKSYNPSAFMQIKHFVVKTTISIFFLDTIKDRLTAA